MRIGKHYGLRASYAECKGYYFPTIIDDKSHLFLFEENPKNITSHNGNGYFNWNKDDWEWEFENRCRWVFPSSIDLEIPDFCIKVQNKDEGLKVLKLLAEHGYTWVSGEQLTEHYPNCTDEIGLYVRSTSGAKKLYVTYTHLPDTTYDMQRHQFNSSQLLQGGNINYLFRMGVPPKKLLF